MSDVRILIVDDNRDFAYLLELSLAALDGCRVVGIAEDGRSALEMIGQMRPDVVLLDIALPETDGLEILKSIGKTAHSPLVFVMSAIRSREIYEEAITLGAAHYFIKPIDIGALSGIIRHAFGSLGAAEKAAELLYTAKVPPDIRGFKYLKEMIVRMTGGDTPGLNAQVCSIAAESGVKTEVVRRAMRYAIRVAWDRDAGGRDSFFDTWRRNGNAVPSADEFVREAVKRITANV